jgi:predicted protein tyrosine phosphatase
MITNNQKMVLYNSYQGNSKKVLCVCSCGVLRSPTAAEVLSRDPYNFNTRSCGTDTSFALIPISEALTSWANEIVCMTKSQVKELGIINKPVICLDIEDSYSFRDPKLIKLIKERYNESVKEF